jgi:long-chain acyl-CoA synthetase
MIVEWGNEHGLPGRTPEQLAKEPAVYQMIQEHVDTLNGQLERWETVKKFVILPTDLSIENGEMTPSMKVRRKVVEKKYMSELDTLYQD